MKSLKTKLINRKAIHLPILIFIGFLLPESVNSQEDPTEVLGFNRIELPAAPNAASLGNYGAFPVGKSSGTINISIPITTISAGNIQLPVNLGYNSGGIRVSDEAGWVGLGWVLNAGGVITRTVRGKADEEGYLYNSSKIPSLASITNGFANSQLLRSTHGFIDRNAKGLSDFEPDVFSFNFGNYSGTFYLSQQGLPELFPHQDMVIEPFINGGNLEGFIVKDNSGIIYCFGKFNDITAYEETLPQFSGGGEGPQPTSYRSAWYLIKVIDPLTGNDVDFEYINHKGLTGSDFNNSTVYSSSETWEKRTNQNEYQRTKEEEVNTLTLYTDVLYVSSISWNTEALDFNISSTITGGTLKLDSIVHSNAYNSEKRTYEFNYENYNSQNNNLFRLKLASFIIQIPTEPTDQEYQFGYNHEHLPGKLSYNIDHWGYFNAAGNSTFLPETSIPEIDEERSIAKKNADGSVSGADMLNSITYPTRGTTTFDFESNTYMRPLTIDDINKTAGSSDKIITDNTSLLGVEYILDISDEFIYDTITYTDLVLRAIMDGVNNQDDPKGFVRLWKNGIKIAEIIVDLNNSNESLPIEYHTITSSDTVEISVMLDSGLPGDIAVEGWLKFSYYDPHDLEGTIEQDAGGQRIKMIENFDPLTNNTTFKEYDYMQSGYLTSQETPKYHSVMSRDCICGEYPCYDDGSIVSIYSSVQRGLGTVAYTHVREYSGEVNKNIGYTDSYFNKKVDDFVGGAPYRPVLNYSWERALQKKEVFVSSSDSGNDTVKVVYLGYSTDNSKSSYIRGFKSARVIAIDLEGESYITDDYYREEQFRYDTYKLETKKINLASKTTVDYFPSGKAVNVINYKYDNPFQSEVTTVETINSDGIIEKTVFKYPGDFVLDCYKPCLSDYKSDYDSCNIIIYDSCFSELDNCAAIHGTCYGQWLSCKMQKTAWIDSHCFNKLNMYRLGCYGMADRECKCNEQLSDCFDENNYASCLSNLGCDATACYNHTYLDFHECKDDIYNCALNKYETASDPYLTAVYLLFLSNAINKPVERTKYVDDVLVEQVKWDYKLFEDNDTVPLLYSVQSKFNSAETLANEMTYEQYVEKLPAQVNIKNSDQKSTYLWSTSGKKLVGFAKNATTEQVFYESFEEDPSGFIFLQGGVNMSKSGVKVKQGSSYSFPETITPGSDLLMSYWYFDGEKWVFKEETFSSQLSVSSGCQYLDEIRVYPKGSEMTTYCYDGFGSLINSTDQNGLSSSFEYDELGRLSVVRDHNKNIVKHYEYNYGHE